MCLKYLKQYENHDVAVGDSRLHILASPQFSPLEIYCFDERESLITYQVSLLLKKNSVHESNINRIIRNSIESGLFIKWNKDTLQINPGIVDTPPLQMTLENMLTPIIFILGIGIPVSMTVFFLEHLVFRKMKQKSKSRIWILLHQMCNPDRLYFRSYAEVDN